MVARRHTPSDCPIKAANIGKYAYYGYDDAGQLDWRIDGNGAVTYYLYDNAGRTSEVRYPAETAYFSYDALGNRTWMANAQRARSTSPTMPWAAPSTSTIPPWTNTSTMRMMR